MEKHSHIDLEQNETAARSPTRHRIRWRAVNSWVLFSFSLTFLITIGTVVDLVLLTDPNSHSLKERESLYEPELPTIYPAWEQDHLVNQTLCSYWKQCDLSDYKKVTVCGYRDYTRIDIRFFIGKTATIKGIWLTTTKWNVLLRLWGLVQTAITEADTASFNGS